MKTSNVFYIPIASYADTETIKSASRTLLEHCITQENIQLENKIPLKVHFGEKGNKTFIGARNFEGIIELLQSRGVESCFTETNAVYMGERTTATSHIALAKNHGFTQLPIEIADGDHGENFVDVQIDKKHFKSCKIAKGIADYKQLLIISHFKGHALAGFGGALKQLAMGCASRGGKLAQHVDAKPFIMPWRCKQCHKCQKHCPVDAPIIGKWSKIDKRKCIGCAACLAVCSHKAIFINLLKATVANKFREKVAEYALAAQKDKRNIYLTFAFNLTKGCDCEGKPMKPVCADMGIFASLDPVAIDTACMDMLDKREGKKVFGGRNILDYAEKIGLGSKAYRLVSIEASVLAK